MSRAVDALLNVLFPEKCARCGAVGAPLCPACAKMLVRLSAVSRRPRHMEGVEAIAAVFSYEEAGGALMRAFKFRGRRRCYAVLCAEFEEAVAEFYREEQIDLVVPVPMHRAAVRERGFNQAEVIARGLAQRMNVPCNAGVLTKTAKNSAQHGLPAPERVANVKGVYAARGALSGKTVLLVDDIVTTGATLCACAQALHRAGAARVVCATVLATP